MLPASNNLGLLVIEIVETSLGMKKTDDVILYVGMDISLSGDENRYAAYGFVTGLQAEWMLFHREWAGLLERHGLEYLRMADAMSFRGVFHPKHGEWGARREELRHQVLCEAAAIIAARLGRGGVSIDFAHTEGSSLPSEKVIKFKKGTLFSQVILQLLKEKESAGSVLALMCDDEQDVAGQFYKVVNGLKNKNPETAHRIGMLCFCDDTRMLHLQAADMVAYVLRQERAGQESPLMPILFRGAQNRKSDVWLKW